MEKCKCKNIDFGSVENYAQTITLELPAHMQQTINDRKREGMTTKVSIDPCIVEEIKELWSKGIITLGCCCGHNRVESMVNVHHDSVRQMADMGYTMNHSDKYRFDTFKLKSV